MKTIEFNADETAFLDSLPREELSETDVEQLLCQHEAEQERLWYENLERLMKAEAAKEELKREGGR